MNTAPPPPSHDLALTGAWRTSRSVASLLASELRARWDQGEPPDVRAALAEYPELAAEKTVALDLAYEEYCRRRETGEPLEPDAFCARFASLKTSLRKRLEMEEFLEEHPQLWEAAPPRWPEPGDLFQGFELRRELGRGAFARVFLAAEPLLGGRAVAVKVSRLGTVEAGLLGRLSHPNVVPIHSASSAPDSDLTAVCMPYLGAATLGDVLDRAFARPGFPAAARVIVEVAREAVRPGELAGEPPPPAPVLQKGAYVDGVVYLAAQLADALAFVHERGICHHDLKPSNVLLTPDARPMLLDFNLSRDAAREGRYLGGTLPYMSPEQLRATDRTQPEAPPPGPASDVFSFGVLLYELLSGTHPFGPIPQGELGPDFRRHLLEQQAAGPRPLRALSPAVDGPLARLVQACLACRPEDRPRAADLAGALRACLSRLRRAARWARRHPLLTAVLLTVTLVAAVAGGNIRSGREPQGVRQPGPRLEANPGSPEEWFGNARASQRRGELERQDPKRATALFLAAAASYQQADKLAPSGKAKAGVAYCLNRLNKTAPALGLYLNATKAGYAPAEVLNNLGYTCLKLRKWQEARAYLNKALEENPRLQAAYHNRALLHYHQAVEMLWKLFPNSEKPDSRPTEAERAHLLPTLDDHIRAGLEDIKSASRHGLRTGELSLDAAALDTLKACRDRLTRPEKQAVATARAHLAEAARQRLPQGQRRAGALPPPTVRLLDPIGDAN